MTENLLDQNADNAEIDPAKNYLEILVGENAKFKTNEDLARGKFQSDHYIKTLEGRLDAISGEYKKVLEERNAMPKLQELIDKLDQQNLHSRENPNSNEDPNRQQTLNPDQLESLVSSKFEQLKQTDKETQNYDQVKSKLSERFGSNYKSVLKEQSQALGLSDDEVNAMARKNPSLFYKTFDLNAPVNDNNFQTPPKSNVRNTTFAPRQVEKRTQSYYNKLLKENPRAYLDPKIAIQMDNDSQALGAEFFDA